MIEVELPDKDVVLEFPDGMEQSEMMSHIYKQFYPEKLGYEATPPMRGVQPADDIDITQPAEVPSGRFKVPKDTTKLSRNERVKNTLDLKDIVQGGLEPDFMGEAVGEPRVLAEAIDIPFKPGRAIARSPGAVTEADILDEGILEKKEASISDIGGKIGRRLLSQGAATEAMPYDAAMTENIGNMGEQIGRLVAETGVEIGIANILIRALAGTIGSTAKLIRESVWWRTATIDDRRLIVQSLDDVIRKNPKMSEGEILRKYDVFRKEAGAKRAKGEVPLTEDKNTIDLTERGDVEHWKRKLAELKKEAPAEKAPEAKAVEAKKELWNLPRKELKNIVGASKRASVDNPGGEWLKYEIEEAKKGGRYGSKTATIQNVQVPVDELVKFEGREGEHKRLSYDDPRVLELAESIKKEGLKEAIFLNVEYDGKVTINEGNHRARAAKLAGLKYVPVEIGYYSGGERASGPMSFEKLIEYKDLKPPEPAKAKEVSKPKEEIKVTGIEDKTVSVEMPKSKAEDLTPKEQKKYLLAEIDTAVKTASDETPQFFPKLSKWEKGNTKALLEHHKKGAKIYSKNKSKFGTVTIEVPGDGEFTILNTKSSLLAFKKGMSKFPATEPKPKKPSVESTKPSGKRIIGEDVHYYNEFKPRKEGVVENKPDEKGTQQFYKDGYFTDKNYIIKTGTKPKLKYKVETKNTPPLEDILKGHKKASPAIIRGESLEPNAGKVSVHVESKDGKNHYIYNAKYFDSILTVHPKAELKVDDDGIAYFIKGKDVVGVTMPFITDKDGFEGLSLVTQEGYKRLHGKPKPRSVKEDLAMAEPKEAPAEAVPSIQFTPIPKGKRRSDLIKLISKKFDVPIRTGKFRKNRGAFTAAGIYKPKAKVVRLAKANDFPTVIHEVGHHIQETMGFKGTMPPEVQAMAYEGATDLDKEGFAEFVRYYVVDQKYAETNAPAFYKAFEESLKQQPDMQDVFVKARQHWNEFQAAPSVAKVHSFIQRGEVKKGRITFNELYKQTIDELNPIKLLRDAAEDRKGSQLSVKDDPFLLAWLNRGWARKAEQYLKTGTFQLTPEGVKFTGKSLREILIPVEKAGEMELLDTYLVAKRAINDPRIVRGFERVLSREDFNQTVIELGARFEKVADELYKYNNELLDYLANSGRISNSTKQTIKKDNLFYTPLYRVMDSDAPGLKGVSKKKFDSIFNPVKRLRGSSRDIVSPTESILKNTFAFINAAERQQIGKAILKFEKIKGMGKFVERVPFPLKPVKVNKNDFLNLLNKYGQWDSVQKIQTSERVTSNSLNPLGGKVEPSEKMVKVAKEALQTRGWSEAEATQIIERIKTAEPKDKQGIIEKTIEKTTIMTISNELGFDSMPSEVIATFRPNYIAGPNEVIFYDNGKPVLLEVSPEIATAIKALDADSLGMISKIMSYPAKWLRAGATLTPEFIVRNPIRDQMTAFLYSNYGYVPGYDLLKGVFHILKQDETYQLFNTSGGAHAALVSLDRNYITDRLKDVINPRGITDLITKPLETLQVLSELTEEGTRVGEFANALKKEGKSLDGILKSGHAARDITLDFSRIGAKTRSINAITAFWNAQVQGADKMFRSFKNNPMRTLLKAVAGVTVPSVLLWWAQHDDPYFQEIPAWRRIFFWNIVTHKEDGSLNHIWSIPKPFEIGILFGSVPEMALDWAYEKDPEGFKETMRSAVESLMPSFIPTALVPIVEWFANRSVFLDRPLVPRSKEELKPVMQYSGRTTETIKLVAELMDKVPGLKEFANPAKIENMLRGYTGGLGRLGLESADWLLKTSGAIKTPPDPSMRLTDLPGIRGFSQRFPSSNSRSIERFYHRYTSGSRDWESLKEKSGHRGYGEKIKKPEQLEKDSKTATVLSILRKSADIIYKSDLSPENKRKSLDNIYINMINFARLALEKKPIKTSPVIKGQP